MISVTATVLRDGQLVEIAVSQLVPSDVVQLPAGNMLPGDVRIVSAKDLFVTQGFLTGESYPVEKFAGDKPAGSGTPPPTATALTSIAFLGTSVESGSATAIVVATGKDTYLGGMAKAIQEEHVRTAFDKGISKFTWLMLRFMLVMVPLVFVINGLTKGSWARRSSLRSPLPWASRPRCCR